MAREHRFKESQFKSRKKYHSQREIKNGSTTTISFEPKANRNFEGLKGILTINSNTYAVQSVDATTFNSGKITVTIQQKYKFIENKYWFPEQLNFEILVGEKPFEVMPNFQQPVDKQIPINQILIFGGAAIAALLVLF